MKSPLHGPVWLVWLTIAAAAPVAAADDSRPNVVLIFADDFGRELLSTYGGNSYATPNLDRLSREGLTFETCYATPLCSPSRVELMTCQYSFRSYQAWGEIDRDADTFVRRLRDAGYFTVAGGKWHMGGWDETPPGIVAAGFDRYWSYNYVTMLAGSFKRDGNRYWGGGTIRDGEPVRLTRYGPDAMTDYVLGAVRDHVASTKERRRPFFAYLPIDLLHRPFMPTPAHPDAPAPGEPPPAEWLGSVGSADHFPAMLSHVDALVGRVLDRLDELDVAEETLVIFTSDNGTDNVQEAKSLRSRYLGREVRGGKYFPTELGLSVPLIVRRPGSIEAGRRVVEPVDMTDLGVTCCRLAGVAAPTAADGRSLLPTFDGGTPTEKPIVYSWGNFDRSSRRYKDPRAHVDHLLDVVRNERWKLYSDERLFDLSRDRFEERPVPPGTAPQADAARRTLSEYRDALRRSEPHRW